MLPRSCGLFHQVRYPDNLIHFYFSDLYTLTNTKCRSGQKITVTLPELDFELGNDKFPLQVAVDGGAPKLEIEWEFDLAFGFDEESG